MFDEGYKTQLFLFICGSVFFTFLTIHYLGIPADSPWVLVLLPTYAVLIWLFFHYVIDFLAELIANIRR